MSQAIRISLLVAIIGLVGCTEASEPPPARSTPEEQASAALSEMLAVAKAGDWGAYIDRFYGESEKLNSPADRDALIARFESKWGPKVVETLTSAVEAAPRIDGDQAIFEQDGQPVFVLHRNASGEWTFHL